MHPLIRLVCFIIFAAFVSLGQYSIIFLGFALLCLTWLISRQWPSAKAWLMLKRMRIFYLSILLLYLWFTPGEIVFSLFDRWSPTYEGFSLAMERILALSLLVLAVETLLRLTPRNLLITGLYYLATPLVLIGVCRNQFIIRVMLTLDLVSTEAIKQSVQKKKPFKSYFQDITQRLADKITESIKSQARHGPLVFELQAPPVLWQWLWPVVLVLLFFSVS